MASDKKRIVGIGELLWDLFPTGDRLGGAPLNFCYHCDQLGAEGIPVSAIGADELGKKIREILGMKGITDGFVEERVGDPTGTVDVQLDAKGMPTYNIKEPVAWDFISQNASLLELAREADAVCFGSLAQRNQLSRESIRSFLISMKREALKIYDINLRQDYFSKEVVSDSLNLSNIFKLSDEELPITAQWFGLQGTIEEQLKELIVRFDLRMVAYTRGSVGSLLVTRDIISDHPGMPKNAVNTVGAGDSFSAALCIGLLEGYDLEEINELSNQVSSFVCTQDSATPDLPVNLKKRCKNDTYK